MLHACWCLMLPFFSWFSSQYFRWFVSIFFPSWENFEGSFSSSYSLRKRSLKRIHPTTWFKKKLLHTLIRREVHCWKFFPHLFKSTHIYLISITDSKELKALWKYSITRRNSKQIIWKVSNVKWIIDDERMFGVGFVGLMGGQAKFRGLFLYVFFLAIIRWWSLIFEEVLCWLK